MGPAGNTPWEVGTPELFNINSSILHDAVSSVEKVRERYCLLIIKQGIIISETYYSNSSETTYETDSAAKTMLGLLIGAVWTHSPWDLDAPLSTFGVNTSIFNEWHDVVTTRHVLSQSSGMGAIAPGIAMTYDSDQYIQTLSPLMNKILEKLYNEKVIRDHGMIVAKELAHVLSGGDTTIDKILSEDDLFKLELDAFMRLIETKETQDRIKHTLATGKPLIN